jgi:hypothetical protein
MLLWKNLTQLAATATTTNASNSSPPSHHFAAWYASILKQTFVHFLTPLLERDLNDYRLDLSCGHLFSFNDPSTRQCVCGLFSLPHGSSSSSSTMMNLSTNDYHTVDESKLLLDSRLENKNDHVSSSSIKLIDCLESKLNAFKVSKDILATILNVGVFISN